MFGYIKPYTAELKVKEYELYRATYCGLCKSMGKTVSHLFRLSLSYDAVFLVLCRMALANQKYTLKAQRCFAHPLKKRPMMEDNPELGYCSKVFALLNYYNIKDKLQDKDFKKKIASAFLYPFACYIKRRAKGINELEEKIKKSLDELKKLEDENCPSPEQMGEVFGQMLSYILSYGLDDKLNVSEQIGLNVGRFIYIADATEDYHKDKKNGDYNPFVSRGINPKTDGEKIENSLLLNAKGTYTAILLTESEDEMISAVIENVSQYGMVKICDDVMKVFKNENQN